MKKRLHLISNAHIDPVWLWEWEEGAVTALSTFRVAADFCEEFEGFVFNHNEAILYKWVEEYDPELFDRIKKLVKAGRWHIMGGWYLQPDCNMPSGEAFIRQIQLGRDYFTDKFGVAPSTAINFDPFGHTRGLVQILAKSGFDSYLVCRPNQDQNSLPSDDVVWIGFDGSKIVTHRSNFFYASQVGYAGEKVSAWIDVYAGKQVGLLLWGLGNHGGGPSRVDINDIANLMGESEEYEILHSTPESYFKELKLLNEAIPEYDKDLNPFAVGCYTSQVRVKQKYRLLENEVFKTEKMLTHAAAACGIPYPHDSLKEVYETLAMAQFHDILPGSGISTVEEYALRLMDHGLEILSRLRAKAFFSLADGQEKAEGADTPILIYNPHPYKVKGWFECELHAEKSNVDASLLWTPKLFHGGGRIPVQLEKALSNMTFDLRKRIVFHAELEPCSISRFDCGFELKEVPGTVSGKASALKTSGDKLLFDNGEMEAEINLKTGLMDRYAVHGVDLLDKNSFLSYVMEDNADPWAEYVKGFSKVSGRFELLDKVEGASFSGLQEAAVESVRVIEDGDVLTVIEAVLGFGRSNICQTYRLPRKGTEIEVELRVFWNEKDRMLKLSIPTILQESTYKGQTAFGAGSLHTDGTETVAQKWVAAVSEKQKLALTVINNGIYGSDFNKAEIRLSLLRSPAYSALQYDNRNLLLQDRFTPRIDQGERLFKFRLNGGVLKERLESVDREALVFNETPFVLPYFPRGKGRKPGVFAEISGEAVQVTAMKRAWRKEGYIFRLYEPTGTPQITQLKLPVFGVQTEVALGAFEVKTLLFDEKSGTFTETNMMEE